MDKNALSRKMLGFAACLVVIELWIGLSIQRETPKPDGLDHETSRQQACIKLNNQTISSEPH